MALIHLFEPQLEAAERIATTICGSADRASESVVEDACQAQAAKVEALRKAALKRMAAVGAALVGLALYLRYRRK